MTVSLPKPPSAPKQSGSSSPERTHGLLRRSAVLVGAALVASAALITACGGSGSDDSKLRARLDKFVEAVVNGDVETGVEIMFPPSLKGDCTTEEIIDAAGPSLTESFGTTDADQAGIRDVEIEFGGDDRATVTYIATYDGIANPSPVSIDWLKEDGEWFVDLGDVDACKSSAASEESDSEDEKPRSKEESALLDRFEEFQTLIRDEDWDGVFDMLSERMRDGCGRGEFASVSASDFADSDLDPADYRARNVDLSVQDDEAIISYDVNFSGLGSVSFVDYWVKEDGEWFDDGTDDNRTTNACGDESSASTGGRTATTGSSKTATGAGKATPTPIQIDDANVVANLTAQANRADQRTATAAARGSGTATPTQPDGPYSTSATASIDIDGDHVTLSGGTCSLKDEGEFVEVKFTGGADYFALVVSGYAGSTVQESIDSGRELGLSLDFQRGGQRWITTSGSGATVEMTAGLMSGVISGPIINPNGGTAEISGSFSC